MQDDQDIHLNMQDDQDQSAIELIPEIKGILRRPCSYEQQDENARRVQFHFSEEQLKKQTEKPNQNT